MKADFRPPTQAAKLAVVAGALVVAGVVALCLYWRGFSLFAQVVGWGAALAGRLPPRVAKPIRFASLSLGACRRPRSRAVSACPECRFTAS